MFRDADGGVFQPRWWGILGLIGWTYLLCAILYLFLNKNKGYLIVALLLLYYYALAGRIIGWVSLMELSPAMDAFMLLR